MLKKEFGKFVLTLAILALATAGILRGVESIGNKNKHITDFINRKSSDRLVQVKIDRSGANHDIPSMSDAASLRYLENAEMGKHHGTEYYYSENFETVHIIFDFESGYSHKVMTYIPRSGRYPIFSHPDRPFADFNSEDHYHLDLDQGPNRIKDHLVKVHLCD